MPTGVTEEDSDPKAAQARRMSGFERASGNAETMERHGSVEVPPTERAEFLDGHGVTEIQV